jgi:ubiquinone/menaquinone biosynthesis C-methylase UbiE
VVLCGLLPEHSIVDVGSGPEGVSGSLGRFNDQNHIVALDLFVRDAQSAPNVTFVVGDATSMPFADREFDIAFCNSLIEHLPPPAQRALADEIRRVARGYCCLPGRVIDPTGKAAKDATVRGTKRKSGLQRK